MTGRIVSEHLAAVPCSAMTSVNTNTTFEAHAASAQANAVFYVLKTIPVPAPPLTRVPLTIV